ncbi:MAG: hypothetical protein WBV06_10580 [Acidimicrobiia bacterium]
MLTKSYEPGFAAAPVQPGTAVGISSIARLDQIDVLVTDSGLPPNAGSILAEHVGELVAADVAEEGFG